VFSLSAPPAGMTINAAMGLLQWTPGSSQVGDLPVTVVAQDSAGQTSQSFTLSVFGSRLAATATISAAAGGVITVSDPASTINGLSITIPAASLAADTTITVSELISPPTLGGTPRFLLKGFSIDPDGTQLAIPAQVTIPYSLSEFATNQGIPLEVFLGVYFVDTSTGGLEHLNSFIVDKVSHSLTGTVPHFSVYEVTNLARLCPPHLSQNGDPNSCPDSYAASSSPLLPAVLVHGLQLGFSSAGAMGNESTWDQLRYLLAGLGPSNQPGSPVRVDAWRFDWDSVYTPFESSAANLSDALQCIEVGQCQPGTFPGLGSSPHLVNLVAHSFGGILVRTYLEGKATSHPYNNDVNRLMTLGTPHSGIGGNLSTIFANACAQSAQPSFSIDRLITNEPITCFEASTGNAGVPGTGAFLNNLNSVALPPLNPSLMPQYDLIAGRRVSCPLVGACSLQGDDGLITTAGNNLCGTLPGGGGVAVGDCSKTSVDEDINADTITLPGATGLCHTAALSLLTCSTFQTINFPMAAVSDTSHPLWNKICSFLGGCTSPRTLTVLSTNPGIGAAITASPADNNQKSSGSTPFTLAYNEGAVLTLRANQTVGGNSFSSWVGCDSAAGTTCMVTMNADRTVAANYVAPTPGPHTLAVASTNPSSGVAITVSPADNIGQSSGITQFTLVYSGGTPVSLTAPPSAGGNNFSSWTGCDSLSGIICTVTMNMDRAVTANYASVPPPTSTLTVASANPSTGIAISVSPADNSGQANGVTQFTRVYNTGVAVTLGASPSAAGNNFSAWTGCDSVAGTACTVTLNANRTVTANYGTTVGHAYVANQNSSDVSAYNIDPTSGTLTPVGTFASGLFPDSVAADPGGRCLYVANSQDSSALLSVFAINPDGTLTQKPPIPTNIFTQEVFPSSITLHPTGKFAYVANMTGNVSVFTVDANTCGMTKISASPFPAGTLPQSATVDPSGNFLYVTNLGDNDISAYKIDNVTGALAPLVGSPFAAGIGPTSLTVHPSGKFAFATSSSDNNVLAYTRDTTTGLLTQLGPFATGGGSFSAAVDPAGNFLYLVYVNGGTAPGDVEVYGVNTASGALTQVGLFATGTSPVSVTVNPSGKFLYVANNGSTSVSAFQIDPNTGTLTPVPPVGFFPAGAGPISVTTTP